MKRSEIFFGLLRIPVDLTSAVGALFAAYYLRAQEGLLPEYLKPPDLGTFPDFNSYVRVAVTGVIVYVIILALFNLYKLRINDSLSVEVRKIFVASLVWLMATITYYFVIRDFPFSRLVLFYAFGFLFLFVSLGRIFIKIIQRYALTKGIGTRLILLVGKNAITDELVSFFHRSKGVKVVGVIDSAAELTRLFETHPAIEEVIHTKGNHEDGKQLIDFCREYHLQYHFVPEVLEVYRTNIEIMDVNGIPVISLRPTALDGWGKVLKRAFDILGATLGLILFSPIFLAIAIAIKLDSAGTVLFCLLDDGTRAKRVGERGKLFQCYKFRTMHMGTHQLRYTELAESNLRKGSPLVKIKNDPRVTRVGVVLRSLSLDELPQLLNVLRGDMSLVGPRPHLPEEVERYDHHHKFVLTIKPGITGLAQISGRSDLPFEEEVRLDTYYIENWSLLMDIKILLKTIFVVIKPYRE